MPAILVISVVLFFVIKHSDDVIYYIPHQDDETLSFGVSIIDDIEQGKDVHIVLLTDGSASVIREKMSLSKEEFTEARNREMEKALDELGVNLNHLSKLDYADGELTVEGAKETIQEYAEKYPEAEHKTFSFYDPHSDHSNSGKALKSMQQKGVVEEAKFFIGSNYTPPQELEIKEVEYKPSYDPLIRAAASSYKIEDEQKSLYGIGYQSVPELFENLEVNPRSIYHEVRDD